MPATCHSPSSHQPPSSCSPFLSLPGLFRSPTSNFQFCPSAPSLSLPLSLCLLFFPSLCLSYSPTLDSCVFCFPSPYFFLFFSFSIPMVVSRLGPPGLGAGAVWAAYTTVFIPLSSSLYSSKALHFFYWVSERVWKRLAEIEADWCGVCGVTSALWSELSGMGKLTAMRCVGMLTMNWCEGLRRFCVPSYFLFLLCKLNISRSIILTIYLEKT